MSNKYTLEIDLNVLHHLGLNLYSNVPAVLSELIANAWDADATNVHVTLDKNKMIITDDGCGMDEGDLQEKFLTIGYRRRPNPNNDKTAKGRLVMGRKGIGKLSAFSVADNIKIFTKKANKNAIGIELDVTSIQKKIEKKEKYYPPAINVSGNFTAEKGTKIVLSGIKKRFSEILSENLKKRVARRFSIFSDAFQVFIDGKKTTIEDREYFSKLEYAAYYGNYDKGNFKHAHDLIEKRENKVQIPDNCPVEVRGWVGMVKESGSLRDENDNLNKLVIFTRGKVAQENILDAFREGGLFTKYLIGEIEADFLDVTGKDDIATSSRQNFIEEDPRFIALKKFIRRELRHFQNKREEYKNKQGLEKALIIPAIKDWYGQLKTNTRKSAKKLFGRINEIATDEKHRRTLFKHGVLAFEHIHYKDRLDEMDNLNIENLETVVKLFSELDDIEASWYYTITEGRLEIIKKIQNYVDKDALEGFLQEHIYTHLWLLDPSWDRATENPSMETTMKKEFGKISKKLTDKEKKGRIDIKYKKTTGEHVIIELKRASVRTSTARLMGQVEKYRQALSKQLELIGHQHEPVEVICVVGKELSDWDNPTRRKESVDMLKVRNIRVITYQSLIHDAYCHYENYLKKSKEKGRILKLLNEIDEYSPDNI